MCHDETAIQNAASTLPNPALAIRVSASAFLKPVLASLNPSHALPICDLAIHNPAFALQNPILTIRFSVVALPTQTPLPCGTLLQALLRAKAGAYIARRSG